MGPRHFCRGIRGGRPVSPRRWRASMGPRHFCRGIQCGRAIEAGDTIASMGPRHFCRGIVALDSVGLRAGLASMGPRHFCRGIAPAHVSAYGETTASMGPRHFCRGIGGTPCELRLKLMPSFNGATAFLPWNWERNTRQIVAGYGLQWGHGISAVEFGQGWQCDEGDKELQWGHGISAVELRFDQAKPSSVGLASMGPRHFCRGIPTCPKCRELPYEASMGPRHFCRGIRGWAGPRIRRRDASMGPRHFCRGINRGVMPPTALTAQLQWGHGISAVELLVVVAGVTGRPRASMGPRHFCRGIKPSEVCRAM